MAIEINKEVGKIILNARKAKKMSRAELGEKVGLHGTTIKKYEDGNIKSLSIDKLKDFSNALDIDLLDMIDVVATEDDFKSFNDTIYCVEKVYGSLTQTLNALYDSGLEKEDVKDFIQKYILDDPESPIYEYAQDCFINVYENIKLEHNILQFGDTIDKVINPYSKISNSTFSLKVADESMRNTVSQNMYAIILKQQAISNGEIALISIDNSDIILRRFYHLNDSTIVLQPDSSDSQFKTIVFEGKDKDRIRIIGKYIGHVSPKQ